MTLLSEIFGGEPAESSIVTTDDTAYRKYKKLKLNSVYSLSSVFHCETECGQYLWVEAYASKIVLCKAETYQEMGDSVDVVARYYGGKPSFDKIVSHMSWEVDSEDIWAD